MSIGKFHQRTHQQPNKSEQSILFRIKKSYHEREVSLAERLKQFNLSLLELEDNRLSPNVTKFLGRALIIMLLMLFISSIATYVHTMAGIAAIFLTASVLQLLAYGFWVETSDTWIEMPRTVVSPTILLFTTVLTFILSVLALATIFVT